MIMFIFDNVLGFMNIRVHLTIVSLVIIQFVSVACQVDPKIFPPSKETFSECSGVYAFREFNHVRKNAVIELYDARGDLWYQAKYSEQVADYDGFGPNNIIPFVYLDGGDYSPVFRCVSYSTNWYAVIAVEQDNEPVIQYMLRNNSLFEWKSWSCYFVGKSLRFDPDSNPIRRSLASEEIMEFPGETARFIVIAVDGDWLHIQWGDKATKENQGWIKWRDETINRTIIGFPR